MFGIDQRVARAAWTVVLVALLLAILYLIRKVLFIFIAAVLFAYLLSPVVNFVDRFLPRRRRTLALAVVYVLLVGILVLLGVTIGSEVGDQAANLAKGLPEIQENINKWLMSPDPRWLEPVKPWLRSALTNAIDNLGATLLPAIREAGPQLFSRIAAVLGGLLLVVIVPILSFFLLKDNLELRERLLASISPERRATVEDVLSDMNHLLGRFIRALVILSAATFASYGIVFTILGVPYSLLLASVAAVLEFIPVLGPFAAAVAIVLVAAFSGQASVWLVLAFLGGYRLFQDYVLSPHLMSQGLELHPVVVVFGVLAGEAIGGVTGMFLSVPVMAALRMVYLRVEKRRDPRVASTL